MTRMRNTVASKLSPVFATTLVQLLVTLCLSLIVGFSTHWHWLSLVAVLAGGGIAIALLLFSVWRALWRRRDELVPERVLMHLYSTEVCKLMLAVLLLGLVFKYASALHPGLVVGGFALASITGSIGLAVLQHQAEALQSSVASSSEL